jgi:ferredoxin
MKVTIDQETCIDCGVCYTGCSGVFEEDDVNSTSQIVKVYPGSGDPGVGQVPSELAECSRSAADACPVEAIHVEG